MPLLVLLEPVVETAVVDAGLELTAEELAAQALAEQVAEETAREATMQALEGGIQDQVAALSPDQMGGIPQGLDVQGGINPAFSEAGPAPQLPQGIDQGLNVQGGPSADFTQATPNAPTPQGINQLPGQNVTSPEYAKDMRDIYGPTPGHTNVEGEFIEPAARYSGSSAPEIKSGLEKGIDSALKFTKEHPLVTSLGIQAAGALFGPSSNGGNAPPRKPAVRKDMSGFNASSPSTVAYNPIYKPTPYAEGGIASYAVGGPIENMSAENAVGSNMMYPQSQLNPAIYSNPMVQRPMPSNVINQGTDTNVDPYTGQEKFAAGGNVQDNEDYVRALAKREMASGIVSDSDVDTRNKDPMNASLTALKKIGKRVGVKTTDMPKSGITDSNVFHAAEGGLANLFNQQKTPAPDPDRKYYNPNNSALRAEEAQNAAQPDLGIFSFLSQMFGGKGTGMGAGAAGFPTLQGFNEDPNKKQIHYTGMAQGGIAHGLGGYSDGGRLLKGPGDGVSDSIPATIGNKQPARLADGEFVVPARIVSELGNGSTDAGARKLYQMMERVQADRKKSIGKDKVAVNSKAAKHLPK